MGSQGREDEEGRGRRIKWTRQLLTQQGKQGGCWQTRWSHICIQINWEEQLGGRQNRQPRVQLWGNEASKPLTEKTCGG